MDVFNVMNLEHDPGACNARRTGATANNISRVLAPRVLRVGVAGQLVSSLVDS
jgi:hypothetical protein